MSRARPLFAAGALTSAMTLGCGISRDEVLGRIQDAIERGRAGNTRGPAMLVQALPAERVARASDEVRSYRLPALSREQLWELVEGPTTDAPTRTAAARALSTRLEGGDGKRLRVAALHCVEPRMRVALEAFVGDEESYSDAASADPASS